MIRWSFDNDYLLGLVLEGKKRATSSIYDGNIPEIGQESIITSNGNDIVRICITNVKVFMFKDAKEEDIIKEGEGNLVSWKKEHFAYFKSFYPEFNDNALILFEEFKVIEKYI